MSGILEKEELPEVLVHRDQNTVLARSPFEDDAVTRISPRSLLSATS
jgi:hypothetical protein